MLREICGRVSRSECRTVTSYLHKHLSSSGLPKHLKIKIHRTVILRAAFYGSENWSLTLREERRLRGFENRVLRGIGIRGGEKTTYGGAIVIFSPHKILFSW